MPQAFRPFHTSEVVEDLLANCLRYIGGVHVAHAHDPECKIVGIVRIRHGDEFSVFITRQSPTNRISGDQFGQALKRIEIIGQVISASSRSSMGGR